VPDIAGGLLIDIGADLQPPSDRHQLLLAFYFGKASITQAHPAVIRTDLSPVDQESVFERWWYAGEVTYRSYGRVSIGACDKYAVACFKGAESEVRNLESFAQDAYDELLQVLRGCRHKQIVKIWNYVGGINDGSDDNERYRQFSVGRARAFERAGILDENAPTGTAIGTKLDAGLTVIALATSSEFRLAENPRQISAFNYPRQYGPKSPKFGRGGLVSADDQTLCLISGTAAVVGHESAHPYDVQLQISETLRNLKSLCEAMSQQASDGAAPILDNASILRVYLRNAEDLEVVAATLRETLMLDSQRVVYLHGNICRRELLVEIDGVRIR
jgi:chorismate lyase / 3-hydroxybenzoate synthase